MKLFVSVLCLFLILLKKLDALRNGLEVQQSDARFIASIRLRSLEEQTLGSGFLCTASLINNWHAITTATCVTKFLISQLQIVLGVEDISTRNSRAVIRDIRRMHFHPAFNRTSESNELYGNVAIVLFSTSIRHSTSRWAILDYNRNRNFHVQPIRISDFMLNQFSICRFFAWGQISQESKRLPHLMMTYLSINNDFIKCNSSNSIFCAFDNNISEPVLCKNLGGALIYDSRLYGIAIRDTCDEVGHFVSIEYYKDWIDAVSSSNKVFVNYFIMFLILISINRFFS